MRIVNLAPATYCTLKENIIAKINNFKHDTLTSIPHWKNCVESQLESDTVSS